MESRANIIRSAAHIHQHPANASRRSGSTGSGPRKQSSFVGSDNVPVSVATHVPLSHTSSGQSSIHRSVTTQGSVQGSVHRPSVHGQSTRSGTGKLRRGQSTDSEMERERERDKLYHQRKAEQVAREREIKREVILEEIRKERITMLVFACISCVTGIFWIVVLSIDHWYFVHGKRDLEGLDSDNKTAKFLSSSNGLWKMCRTVQIENEDKTNCTYHSLFPDPHEIKLSDGMDQHVIDYQRTTVSFAVISILLLPMAIFASFYTFRNARYTFKRLTACLYFLLAITVLVVIEVVITSVSYQRVSVPYHHPKNSSFSYGFCFYTGWIVFLVYLVTAALFLAYSRKRKGDKALDDDDEGQFMGR